MIGVYDRTKSKPNKGIFKKGHILSENALKKLRDRILPIETRKRMSINAKTKGMRPPSRKGATITEEHKQIISKANKGKRVSAETRRKMSLKSYNWKGGKSRDKYHKSWKYNKWRRGVFLRDNFTCALCGTVGGRLEAHHLYLWSKYPKLRYRKENGVTLCVSCHKAAHRFKFYKHD